nr:FTR1 family protein [Acidovorax sp. SUPP2522]
MVLRESAELILILGSLVASLRSTKAEHLLPWVAGGATTGCAAGVALCLWLASSSVDSRWTAGLTFVLAFSVLLMVSTMLVAQSTIRSRTQTLVANWLEKPAAPLIVLAFCALAGLRETLEAGLFLRSLWIRADSSDVLVGATLGLVGVPCLAIASLKLSTRIGILAAFRLSALLLSLLAIQMMLGSLAEFARASAGSDGTDSHLLQIVLPNGRWYTWFCAALMFIPASFIVRGWWKESARLS